MLGKEAQAHNALELQRVSRLPLALVKWEFPKKGDPNIVP